MNPEDHWSGKHPPYLQNVFEESSFTFSQQNGTRFVGKPDVIFEWAWLIS
jgi:hypothetical protein